MTQREFINEVVPLQERLFRFALSKVFQRDEAEEIVQEVFLKLWQQRARLSQIENKEAWCVRCTRNLIIDRARAGRKKVNLELKEDLVGGQQADEKTLHQDLVRQVHEVLQQLPQRQREIFRLRDLAGYSNQEIEEILQLSTSEVRVNLCRARKKVRQLLSKKIHDGVIKEAKIA